MRNSKDPMVRLANYAIFSFFVIGAIYLVLEHSAQRLGALPLIFLLAGPLLFFLSAGAPPKAKHRQNDQLGGAKLNLSTPHRQTHQNNTARDQE